MATNYLFKYKLNNNRLYNLEKYPNKTNKTNKTK